MSDRTEVDALVRRVQAGDSVSFERLFELYYPPVYHFLLKNGVGPEDSEEITQNALIRVYQSIERFRWESSFDTWLFTIVRNLWKNHLRGLSTQKRSIPMVELDRGWNSDATSVASRTLELSDESPNPHDRLLEAERQRLLGEALAELPPRLRQCMLLRIGQGLRYKEIAAVMKVSVVTVKSQLNTAKKRLRELLQEEFGPAALNGGRW